MKFQKNDNNMVISKRKRFVNNKKNGKIIKKILKDKNNQKKLISEKIEKMEKFVKKLK